MLAYQATFNLSLDFYPHKFHQKSFLLSQLVDHFAVLSSKGLFMSKLVHLKYATSLSHFCSLLQEETPKID